MSLAENLKKLRKDYNLSQEQLADKLGVSRQSVSKWESNQAYPEMDKMLQIAKLFNVNIDDLLHNDIVEQKKDNKDNINKYITSFLEYVTKTIDMFSSMSFKEKLKCVLEEVTLLFILFMICAILGSVGYSMIGGLFHLLPYKVYIVVYQMIKTIYTGIATLIVVVLLCHIFKVRYLDYYEIAITKSEKEIPVSEKKEVIEEEVKEEKKKIVLEKKKEKLIIRDPEDTEYHFMNVLIKCVLFFAKMIVAGMAFMLCCSLIVFVLCLVAAFLISGAKLLFSGIECILFACIFINILFLSSFINFILDRKNNKKIFLYTCIFSLLLGGLGSGLVCLAIPKFTLINASESNIEKEIILPMQTDTLIDEMWIESVVYIEENRNDLRIVYNTNSYTTDLNIRYRDNWIIFDHKEEEPFEIIKKQIDNINNYKIEDYEPVSVKIYTSKKNIDALKENKKAYWKEKQKREKEAEEMAWNKYYEEEIKRYEERIEELERHNQYLEDVLYTE